MGRPKKWKNITNTKSYRAWERMWHRCETYPTYIERKITVCSEWESFDRFIEDMGEPLESLTLDRKDNSLGYFKENCRWVSMKVQGRNRDSNRWYEFRGERKVLFDWAQQYGMKFRTLHARLERGWTFEEAITTPVKG